VIVSPTLEQVRRGELCTGCGLCAALSDNAFSLIEAGAGYLRPPPKAALSPTAEAAVKQACPGNRIPPWPTDNPIHPYWGPIGSGQTGHATDPDVRFLGSSGGVLTGLAIFALERGLVDGIVHVAADPAQPTRNCNVLSRDRASILGAAGSHYAPSSPLAQVDALLASGERYMLIGKPCDVSALSALGEIDPRVAQVFPYRLSFYCGGIPSFAGTDRFLAALGLAGLKLASFRFRGNGWPGLTEARTAEGQTATMRYAESWGRYLSAEVQYRCKICPDVVGGAADIAAADAWYSGETGYPTFEEQDGRSLVIGRSAAGQELLALARASGAIMLEDLAVQEIDLMQPSQARRKRLILARTAAARTMLQPLPQMRGLNVGRAARRAKVSETIHNYLGSLRRIIVGRR
jgi:coenzyme F420 hydrogenase subunit beta